MYSWVILKFCCAPIAIRMQKSFVVLSLFWISVSSKPTCHEYLKGQNETKKYTNNKKYTWCHAQQNFEGIFLKFEESQLLNISNGNCISDIRPTGNRSEIRTCLWQPPACYFFTKNKTGCKAFITKNNANCEQTTWIVKANLPTKMTLYVKNGTTTQTNFTFSYEYFNCSDGLRDDSGITVSDFLSDVIKGFSGNRIIYVLAAGIFFILLSILLTVIIIFKSMELRKLKNTANESSNGSMPDLDHLSLSPWDARSSMHSNNIEVFTTEEHRDDNVYHSVQDTAEKVKKLSRSTANPYEDVTLSNDSSTNMRREMSSTNERESTPVLPKSSADQDVNSHKSPIHHAPASAVSTSNRINVRNSSRLSVSAEENGNIYDKVNEHQKEQLTDEISPKQGGNGENPNNSETIYDCAATESIGVAGEVTGFQQNKAELYEDVSGIPYFGDSQNGNYTNLNLNDSKPRDGSEFHGDLYDKVERK